MVETLQRLGVAPDKKYFCHQVKNKKGPQYKKKFKIHLPDLLFFMQDWRCGISHPQIATFDKKHPC